MAMQPAKMEVEPSKMEVLPGDGGLPCFTIKTYKSILRILRKNRDLAGKMQHAIDTEI